jgi:hypothetical protein
MFLTTIDETVTIVYMLDQAYKCWDEEWDQIRYHTYYFPKDNISYNDSFSLEIRFVAVHIEHGK